MAAPEQPCLQARPTPRSPRRSTRPVQRPHPAVPAVPAAPGTQVTPDMPVPDFLAAAEPLIAPLDAYFDKVFVMCDNEVSVRY